MGTRTFAKLAHSDSVLQTTIEKLLSHGSEHNTLIVLLLQAVHVHDDTAISAIQHLIATKIHANAFATSHSQLIAVESLMSDTTTPSALVRLEMGGSKAGIAERGDGGDLILADKLGDEIVGIEHTEDLGGVFRHDAHRE